MYLSVLLYFDISFATHVSKFEVFQFFFISTGGNKEPSTSVQLSVLLYFDPCEHHEIIKTQDFQFFFISTLNT